MLHGLRLELESRLGEYAPGVLLWLARKLVFPGTVLIALMAGRAVAGAPLLIGSFLPPELTLFALRFAFAGAGEASNWLEVRDDDPGKSWPKVANVFFRAAIIPTAAFYTLSIAVSNDVSDIKISPSVVVAAMIAATIGLGLLAFSTHLRYLRDKNKSAPKA